MASSISAGTTSSTALVATADTSGALQLATNNGTVAVTIDTSQNVGIGATVNSVFDQVAASRPLVVQKSDSSTTLNGSAAAITITNGDTTTSNTAQLNFAAITGASTNQYSSAIISCIFGARTNGQYPTGILTFSTSTSLNSAPTEKMRIDSSGNVGIGTTSPSAKFHVAGGSGSTIRNTASAGSSWFVGSNVDSYILHNESNTPMVFTTNGTEQARITAAGLLQFNSGYGSVATAYGCRVWVNFNGTTSSPSTIRGSGNVTSVTKNGSGDFTINFTTALVDTNYAPMITADRGGHAAMGYKPTTIATSSYRFTSVQQQGTALDSEFTSVTIFR